MIIKRPGRSFPDLSWAVLIFTLVYLPVNVNAQQQSLVHSAEYTLLQQTLASGWNTWNTRSVLSHVLLPQGAAINIQLKDSSGHLLREALIGRQDKDQEQVQPGDHAYDGTYTDLTITWHGIRLRVQSAAKDSDLFILVTPLQQQAGEVIISPSMLWNSPGAFRKSGEGFTAQLPAKQLVVFCSGSPVHDPATGDTAIAYSSGSEVLITTRQEKEAGEIKNIIREAQQKQALEKAQYGPLAALYEPMQTVLAWNVIYEPVQHIVIAPVSRIWNVGWGGWVLFDWDTYFATYMLSMTNKNLAYANAIAVTDGITESGFIPNFSSANGKSLDRSQPPLGSFVIYEIYKHYQEKWFLSEVFDRLLTWNRWWDHHRQIKGYLCWGSDPYSQSSSDAPKAQWLSSEVNRKQGAKWESGLDNSPMYDNAVFDTTSHCLLLADVGLMSMYILDCHSLEQIALALGKNDIARELDDRALRYTCSLQTLWDDQTGLFLNKHLDDNRLSYRLSPTLFYPLLAGAATQEQAGRMIKDHFDNPAEFYGKWMIPSIARNDSAFKDNDYWRGRIWAPMNFLVYLGLRKYDLSDARRDLVERSKALLLKGWSTQRHVYENYNAVTGNGNDVGNSDRFYHWGALLGFMSFIENGKVPSPDN